MYSRREQDESVNEESNLMMMKIQCQETVVYGYRSNAGLVGNKCMCIVCIVNCDLMRVIAGNVLRGEQSYVNCVQLLLCFR